MQVENKINQKKEPQQNLPVCFINVSEHYEQSWRLTGSDSVCVGVPHHSQHAEASLAQQVAQVGDGGVGGDVGGEASLPLGFGELEGTAELVQGLPAHHRPDEHPVRLQHLVDLRGGGGRVIYSFIKYQKGLKLHSLCKEEETEMDFVRVCIQHTT